MFLQPNQVHSEVSELEEASGSEQYGASHCSRWLSVVVQPSNLIVKKLIGLVVFFCLLFQKQLGRFSCCLIKQRGGITLVETAICKASLSPGMNTI